MSISISGSGTITGISAGGLPDGCVTGDDIANSTVTATKLGTTEQSRLCRAWVNFDGTGTVAIRASFNVSSITDNGVGDYTVNFTTAMPDANYAVACGGNQIGAYNPNTGIAIYNTGSTSVTTTSVRVQTGTPSNGVLHDIAVACVAIFR